MIPCPGCGRPNAPQRTTCLYCGAVLPGGGAPASTKPALPSNLDELVAAAFRKGEITKLKQAIEESRRDGEPAAEGAPPIPAPTVGPPTGPRPVEPRPAPPTEPRPAPVAPPVDPGPLLRQLAESSAALELSWRQGASIAEGLDTIAALLSQLRALSPPAELPPVVLPPIRQEWALVLESPSGADAASALAEALELDLATARMLTPARAVRVVRRALGREELERFAARLRERMGLRATILSREALRKIAPPRFVLRLGAQRWSLADGPLWELDPERLAAVVGEEVAPGEVRFAVVGEVVTRRYRASAGGRGARKDLKPELVAERRVGVVDLHGPGLFLRLVEAASDPSPHAPPSPALPRFRAFIDGLAERFPGIYVEARRVCRPMDTPTLREGAEHNEGVEVSGWPIFEEHTRMCRLHLLSADG